MKRLALAAVLVIAAGCGGDTRLPVLPLEPEGRFTDREPGLTVLRFVQAARAGNTARMRVLMSASTRASFGPGAAEEIAADLADFSQAQIASAAPASEGWAVAAVTGVDEDGEPVAWAAALRREGGRWRLELGGVFFTRLRPAPLAEVEPRPEIRVEAQAGDEVDELQLWIGSRPVRAHAIRRHPFTREIWGRLGEHLPPGVHTALVFAAAGDTAGAFAWSFEVSD